MKKIQKAVWITSCVIAVIFCAGLMLAERRYEPPAGKIIYVSSRGEDVDSWKWRLTEKCISDGAEKVLLENDEQVFLLESVHGQMACAVMDSQEMLTVYDFQSGGVLWQGDASGVAEPERDVVTFDSDYLYVACGGGGISASVIRMDIHGREEEVGRFEDENAVWFDCFTISPDGKIACSMRSRVPGKASYVHSVCIQADGRRWVAAEGSAPRWIGENELLFVQNGTVMKYRCDTGDCQALKTGSEKMVRVATSSPMTVLDPYCMPGHLVYGFDTSNSASMPNSPDVCVTSLEDGKTFQLKRVNIAQFGNQTVFVISNEGNL